MVQVTELQPGKNAEHSNRLIVIETVSYSSKLDSVYLFLCDVNGSGGTPGNLGEKWSGIEYY
jgi:hypothetical protein